MATKQSIKRISVSFRNRKEVDTVFPRKGDLVPVVKKGYLLKQGHKVKNWKRRYFVISSDSLLCYFKDEFDPDPALGMIFLMDATIEDGAKGTGSEKFSFHVQGGSSDAKDLYISCPDASTKNEWMQCLEGLVGDSRRDLLVPCGTLRDKCVIEGFLNKKGAKRRNWKTRYFLISNNKLYYFKSNDSDELPIGIVSLKNSVVAKELPYNNKNNLFSIRRFPRPFLLQAGSESAVDRWISSLSDAGASTRLGGFAEPMLEEDGGDESDGEVSVSSSSMTSLTSLRRISNSMNSAMYSSPSHSIDNSSTTTPSSTSTSSSRRSSSSAGSLMSLSSPRLFSLEVASTVRSTTQKHLEDSLDSYRKVSMRIRKAREENPHVLSIVSESITRLPINDMMAMRSSLTHLCLSFNDIKTLPSEVCLCTNLKRLLIHNNALTFIPSEIGLLSNLQELYINSNSIETLPAEIGSLTQLTELSVSNNKLRTLPPEIGKLTRCNLLLVSSNKISLLPSEICLCTALEHFYVNDNLLRWLPSRLGQLNHLREFVFGQNPVFTSLSPLLVSIAKRSLDPSDPSGSIPRRSWSMTQGPDGLPLGIVPERILEKTNEEIISMLGRDSFIELMEELKERSRLEEEVVQDDEEDEANEDVVASRRASTRSTLTHGTLVRNSLVGIREEDLEPQPQRQPQRQPHPSSVSNNDVEKVSSLTMMRRLLRSIDIARKERKTQLIFTQSAGILSEALVVPPAIQYCASVSLIDLSGNNIKALPSELFSLPKLTDLSLSSNCLSTFPPELKNASKLQSLVLSSNRLSCLNFSSLCALEHLTVLDASFNGMSSFVEPENEFYELGDEMEAEAAKERAAEIAREKELEKKRSELASRLSSMDDDTISTFMKRKSLFRGGAGNMGGGATLLGRKWQAQNTLVKSSDLEISFNSAPAPKHRSSSSSSTTTTTTPPSRLVLNQPPDVADDILRLHDMVLPSPNTNTNPTQSDTQSLLKRATEKRRAFLGFRNLASLLMLNLSHNSISRLPHAIGALPSLTELDLSFNELRELPSSIGTLSRSFVSFETNDSETNTNPDANTPNVSAFRFSMLKLHLGHNLLRSLPTQLGHLSSLTLLDLSSNNLVSLPSSFGHMSSIEVLLLSNNVLESLPHELCECKMLREIYLSGNRLQMLPSWMGSLPALSDLRVGGNRLFFIPSELCRSRSLSSLELHDNALVSLPSEFGSLSSPFMSRMTLWGNPFPVPPAEVFALISRGVDVQLFAGTNSGGGGGGGGGEEGKLNAES